MFLYKTVSKHVFILAVGRYISLGGILALKESIYLILLDITCFDNSCYSFTLLQQNIKIATTINPYLVFVNFSLFSHSNSLQRLWWMYGIFAIFWSIHTFELILLFIYLWILGHTKWYSGRILDSMLREPYMCLGLSWDCGGPQVRQTLKFMYSLSNFT